MGNCYYDTMSDMQQDAYHAIDWGDEDLQCNVMDTCDCNVKDWVMKLSYDEFVTEMKSNLGVSQEDFEEKYLWDEDDVVEEVVEEPVEEVVEEEEVIAE